MKNRNKKIGVFGGGGALGAYSAGVLSKLRPKYDVTIGTSTGSLLAALSVCGKYNELADAYMSVTPDKIFDRNPFTKDGKIKVIRALWKIIQVKLGLTEVLGLEALIRFYYTESDHQRLKKEGKSFVVTATRVDINPAALYFFDSSKVDYHTMVKAMLASCSVPIVMPPVKIEDKSFLDGGVIEPVPLNYVLDKYGQYADFDVFVHRPNHHSIDIKGKQLRNMFTLAGNLFDAMMSEITKNDLARIPNNAKLYELPYSLSENPLLFNKKSMSNWVKMGRYYAGILMDQKQ